MKTYVTMVILALLATSAAQADITAESPTTDWHAYTLNSNEYRVGLHTLEYGVLGRAEIGVAHYLWLFKVRNGFGKLRIYDTEDLSVSISAGYLNFNTADLEVKEKDQEGNVTAEPNIDLFSVTAGLNISKRLKSFTLSGSFLYAYSGVLGSAGDKEEFGGALIGTTGILRLVTEYRLSPHVALELAGHSGLFEVAAGELQSGVQALDSGTPPRATLEIFGKANIDLDGSRKLNAIFSVLLSYSSFNLKLGGGYGHLNLPLAGVFVPEMVIPLAVLDMYWRF